MGRFILFFLILFVLELFVIIQVGSALGALTALTMLFVSMILGAFIVKLRFRQALLELQNNGRPSLHILWLPMAGFFFLFPGFISDLIAVLLLLPPVQHALESFMRTRVRGFTFTQGGFTASSSNSANGENYSGGRTFEGSFTEVTDEALEHKTDDREDRS